MPNVNASARRRAPQWGGYCVADLAHATAVAMTLVYREQPIIGVVSSAVEHHLNQEQHHGETRKRKD